MGKRQQLRNTSAPAAPCVETATAQELRDYFNDQEPSPPVQERIVISHDHIDVIGFPTGWCLLWKETTTLTKDEEFDEFDTRGTNVCVQPNEATSHSLSASGKRDPVPPNLAVNGAKPPGSKFTLASATCNH